MEYDVQEFDPIRPYHDEELPAVFEELLANEQFRAVMRYILPHMSDEQVASAMRACKTKLDFQKTFCLPFLQSLVQKTANGLTLDHSALKKEDAHEYTYLSNHRDIVLDSALLSALLVEYGKDTVEIAIGDNLLIYPWIKQIVRINKSFAVERGLTMRQILQSSMRMSRYMHYVINEKKESIWMAQREGRSKDSSDHTADSIIKMLVMGGEGSIIDRLVDMHIVPLAISFEYDPCDYLKALEFQLKRDNPDYKKSPEDDLLAMQTGVLGQKGHIHYQFAPCIDDELHALPEGMPKSELFSTVAQMIDKGIHANYRLYPGNYVAYDLLEQTTHMEGQYSAKDKAVFVEYLDSRLAKIDIPNKDESFLREKLLTMYANPVRNYLKAIENV
ncbi:MAG TPA: acyltransferase [Bacteroidaceae bacterium]|nr:acyltransferase [Bacteroidaceae bacterium]